MPSTTSRHRFASLPLRPIISSIAVTAIFLTSTAAPAGGDHSPKHGGVVAAGKAADYELVVKADGVRLYVSDHGKPMDLSKAAAKVTVLTGADKQQFDLKPAGNRLEAPGPVTVRPGATAVAVVTNQNKTLGTAQFKLP